MVGKYFRQEPGGMEATEEEPLSNRDLRDGRGFNTGKHRDFTRRATEDGGNPMTFSLFCP
jgi:hypothetical protein